MKEDYMACDDCQDQLWELPKTVHDIVNLCRAEALELYRRSLGHYWEWFTGIAKEIHRVLKPSVLNIKEHMTKRGKHKLHVNGECWRVLGDVLESARRCWLTNNDE